jgi:hypothetical protein
MVVTNCRISPNIAPMIRAVICILFLFSSFYPAVAISAENVMNLRAHLTDTIVKKMKEQPDISFAELMKFANEQEPVSVRVSFKNYWSEVYSRTACGSIEAELPVVSFDGEQTKIKTPSGIQTFSKAQAEPATIRWNSKTYLAAGEFAPYRVNTVTKTLSFHFPLPQDRGIGTQEKWWQELIGHLPILAIEEFPFLIVESTPSGLKFATTPDAYQRSGSKEVRATHSELAAIPFSKIFFYAEENQRIQVPQTCR